MLVVTCCDFLSSANEKNAEKNVFTCLSSSAARFRTEVLVGVLASGMDLIFEDDLSGSDVDGK